MRIVGLLILALAGTAFASEDRHERGLARFAYVNTSVFQRSFGELVPQPPLQPAAPESVNGSGTDFRPVLLVAAEGISGEPLESTESARALANDGIETMPLLREIETVSAADEAAPRLASLEPTYHLADHAPDELIAAHTSPLVHAPPILKHTRQRSARATLHKRTRVAKKKVASAGVPKWATKMFDGPWQQHAFAYQ